MDYKEKYELGSIVTARRTYNREIITGEFGGFHLLDKSNPKSIVGVVHTSNGSYDVEPNSIESVISEDERIRKWLIYVLKSLNNSPVQIDGAYEMVLPAIAWLEKQGNIDKASYDLAEKEKREFVGDGFIKCYADFQDFKGGETYWLEYLGNDNYNVRSDNLLGKTYHITPCQLYTIFKKQTWLEKQEILESIKLKEAMLDCQTCIGYKNECFPDRNIFKCSYPIKYSGEKPQDVDEKQGEQKPVISDDALREGIAHFGITQYQIDNWLKKYVDVEKQGGQKPIEWSKQQVVNSLTSMLTEKIRPLHTKKLSDGTLTDREEMFMSALVEIRSFVNSPSFQIGKDVSKDWSEVEQLFLTDIVGFLCEAQNQYPLRTERTIRIGECIDWLKSLKGRVQPQQEWSDEDVKMLLHTTILVESCSEQSLINEGRAKYKDIIYWLKSLQQRILKGGEE